MKEKGERGREGGRGHSRERRHASLSYRGLLLLIDRMISIHFIFSGNTVERTTEWLEGGERDCMQPQTNKSIRSHYGNLNLEEDGRNRERIEEEMMDGRDLRITFLNNLSCMKRRNRLA